jgi:hypothetical protein
MDVKLLGLDWTADGESLVFSSNRGGNPRLWKVSANGGTPEHLLAAGDSAYSVSISHREQLLIYTRQLLNTNIWRTAGANAVHKSAIPNDSSVKLIGSTTETWPRAFRQTVRESLSNLRALEARRFGCVTMTAPTRCN